MKFSGNFSFFFSFFLSRFFVFIDPSFSPSFLLLFFSSFSLHGLWLLGRVVTRQWAIARAVATVALALAPRLVVMVAVRRPLVGFIGQYGDKSDGRSISTMPFAGAVREFGNVSPGLPWYSSVGTWMKRWLLCGGRGATNLLRNDTVTHITSVCCFKKRWQRAALRPHKSWVREHIPCFNSPRDLFKLISLSLPCDSIYSFSNFRYLSHEFDF